MISKYFSLKRLKYLFSSKNISKFSLIDSNSYVSTKSRIHRFVKILDSKVDDYTYIGPHSQLTNCKLGKFCSISSNVTIGLGLHPISHLSSSPVFYSPNNGLKIKWTKDKLYDDFPKFCHIGNDVWIGLNAVIMGGVNIGDGAIIAANAFVNKDVPPFAIVGGIPAKLIRFRFDDNIIQELLKIKWWELDPSVLQEKINLFNTNVDLKIIKKLNE